MSRLKLRVRGQNFVYFGRHCMCRSKIWHLRRQKFACLKVVLYFWGDFQGWKYTFYKKCSKNVLVSEKNCFFPLGGSRPQSGIFQFFFEPFLNQLLICFDLSANHFGKGILMGNGNPQKIWNGYFYTKKVDIKLNLLFSYFIISLLLMEQNFINDGSIFSLSFLTSKMGSVYQWSIKKYLIFKNQDQKSISEHPVGARGL